MVKWRRGEGRRESDPLFGKERNPVGFRSFRLGSRKSGQSGAPSLRPPAPAPTPPDAALGAAGTGQDIHLLQFDVLPGIGGARPSTRQAGPRCTIGVVHRAAYPCRRGPHGRRFGHPGGGAVLMLPQGPAGLRSARLAPPRKKARPSPAGALRPCLFSGASAALSFRPRCTGPKSGPVEWWPCFGPVARRPHPVQTGAAA